jgi:hypothetical protein
VVDRRIALALAWSRRQGSDELDAVRAEIDRSHGTEASYLLRAALQTLMCAKWTPPTTCAVDAIWSVQLAVEEHQESLPRTEGSDASVRAEIVEAIRSALIPWLLRERDPLIDA